MSSVVWALGTALKVLREKDYGGETRSIAAKMAAKRVSTSAPHAGVGKNVELGFPDGGEHARGDRVGLKSGVDIPGNLGHHRRC
jgi:hypothetical protein